MDKIRLSFKPKPTEGGERERWHSDIAFVFAAIGAAVGLGNFWRFPALAARHGGGLFLVPYVLSLILVGIPLVLLEMGVGQKFQRNAYDAFAHVHRYAKGAGLGGALVGGIIVVYYMAIIGWSLVFFVYSFSSVDGELPWAKNPSDFFFNTVLELSEGPDVQGGLVMGVSVGTIIAWLITGLCIFRGPQTVSFVVYVTMPLPLICLLVLLVRALTLPGASNGIYYYVTGSKENVNPLGNLSVWVEAMGQIFFSVGVGMGILPAYSGWRDHKKPILRDGLIVSFANSAVSLICGLVVFGFLGNLAYETNQTMEQVSSAGVGLAFTIFPYALSLLPGGLGFQQFFSVVFFLMVFSLGLDSAFALVEGLTAIIVDNLKTHVRREYVSMGVILAMALMGLGYTCRGGLYYLDIVDKYNNLMLPLVGIFEVLAVAWAFPPLASWDKFKDVSVNLLCTKNMGVATTWAGMVRFVVVPLVALVQVVGWVDEARNPYGGYPLRWRMLGWALYIFIALVIVVVGALPYKPLVDGETGKDIEYNKKEASVDVRS